MSEDGFTMPDAVIILAGHMVVPNELLADQVVFPLADLFRERTPEEISARAAREAAATKAVRAAYQHVLDTAGTHPAAAAVLRLHHPAEWHARYCEGCDGDTEWPCQTTLLVVETMGVTTGLDPWTEGYTSVV